MGEMRNALKILIRHLEGENQVRDLDIDRRIALKLALKKFCVRVWNGFR
jgi:hypothetical protein